MMWDAFCEEHFDEALEHITERESDCYVGYCEATTPEEMKADELLNDDDYKCGYPDCNKYPVKDIIWIEKDIMDNPKKSSKYVGLEDLK